MPNKELLQKMYDELPTELGKGFLLMDNLYCAVGFGLHIAGIPDDRLDRCRTRLVRQGSPLAITELSERLGVPVEAADRLMEINDGTSDYEQRVANVRNWLMEQLSTANPSSQTP